MALTDVSIKNALPQDKKIKLFDGGGLYLLVMPNGSKYFRYDYRFNGKTKTYSLGVYPAVSLKEARIKLGEVKATLAQGKNPNQEKKKDKLLGINRAATSFYDVSLEWWNISKAKVSVSHAEDKLNKLQKDVFPFLGDMDIKDITVSELLAVLRKIEARGAIETAHRIRGIVGEVYAYAIAAGKAERNIANDLKGAMQARPAVQHMATITQPAKVGELLRAVWGYEGDIFTSAALKLLAYTFLRVSELSSLIWQDIDYNKMQIKIPAERMKKRRPHIVPICRQTLDILQALPKVSNYLFPSLRSKSRHINPFSLNAALRRLGYQSGEMTAHGFRGMASTLLYENGFTADIVELQLAHVEDNAVKAAYNHAQHLQRRADMVQWYADYLDGLRELKA